MTLNMQQTYVNRDGKLTAEGLAALRALVAGGVGGGATNLTYTAATRLLESSTGTDVTLPLAGANPGLMSAADKTKLDGVATGATAYTDELAQDAVGAMVDASLTYVDGTPLLQRAALTGAVTASAGSNATALGSFTVAQLNTALSDGDVTTGGGTASGTNTGDQTSIVGITGTKAQFDTAVSDGNILYVGDVTQYTDALARAAVHSRILAAISMRVG